MTWSNPPGTMPSDRLVTVVIPTRDRPAMLASCLEALFEDADPRVMAEVIVVDNSDRGTALDVVRSHSERPSARVRAVHEPVRGLSRARNRGLDAASGAVVAFIDDDCQVASGYWQSLFALAEDVDVDFWFGPITLGDPLDARIGIDEDFDDWVMAAPTLARPGTAQGANLVVRASFAHLVGGFDTRLGAGTLFRCEDLDFIARALRSGGRGRHVPHLHVVHHHGRRRRSRAALRIEVANSVAIGAFYAKQATLGDMRYLRVWLERVVQVRGPYGRRLDLKAGQCAGLLLYLALRPWYTPRSPNAGRTAQ